MATSVSQLFARPAPQPRQRSFLELEEGWLSVLLLLAMVLSTVWSIDQAHWVEGTGVLFPMALVGVGAGIVLARMRLQGWIAVLLGLVLGIAVTFAVVGQLVPPPGEWLGALAQALAGTITWFRHPVGLPPLVSAFVILGQNIVEFGGRIGLWTQIGATGRVSN